MDLGTGHGTVARGVARSFTRVVATDPSPGMLRQARALSSDARNIAFEPAAAEELAAVPTASVDMVVSGQAAHWFDYARWWPEMRRVLRPGGTLAVWGYTDPVLVGWPGASRVLAAYMGGAGPDRLGDYCIQPGRRIVVGRYRAIAPPPGAWDDVRRVEYEPSAAGPRRGRGELLLASRKTVRDAMECTRTWSAVHKWQEAHPHATRRSEGGEGDVVDYMFDDMREAEVEWLGDPDWLEREVDIELGTGLLMARRR